MAALTGRASFSRTIQGLSRARVGRPLWALPSGPANHPARLCSRMLAVLEDVSSIHKNVKHALRELMWLVEGCVVLHAAGIEHHDVGEIARFQSPASA